MYRLGRKQKRAILDENGIEIALFHRGLEEVAELACDLLNNYKHNNIVECRSCGENVEMISTGEICPKCYY